MSRRTTLWGALAGLVSGSARAQSTPRFPPVPTWRPSFQPTIAEIVDRFRYYTDGKRDFSVFRNGTVAILPADLSDSEARLAASGILERTYRAHPDMNPKPMDDGNILITYNEPLANVVLAALARAHWAEVEARHLDGLAPAEVLITPDGPNKFDDFGKQGLLGRCYMFMDAQEPEIVRLERASAT